MDEGKPNLLAVGEWHLPFISRRDWEMFPQDFVYGGDGYSYDEALEGVIVSSVARCASVSYNNFDGNKATYDQDIERYNKLVNSRPIHASPLEHQAIACKHPGEASRNFRGFTQYREILERKWQNQDRRGRVGQT